jgi:O-antigen ligase
MRPQEIIQRVRISTLIMAVVLLPYSIAYCHFFILLFIVTSLIDGKFLIKVSALLTNPLSLLFILFFLIHLIGILYSSDQKNAWLDIEKKAFFFALPIVLVTSSSLPKEEVHRLFNWFIASCVIATFACLYYGFVAASNSIEIFNFNSVTTAEFYSPYFSNVWKFFTYGHLASGININPSYFSLYLIFCLLLLSHFNRDFFRNYSSLRKIGLALLWIYVSIFVILLSSRIMIIALLGLTAFTGYTYASSVHALKKIVFLILVVGVLCGLIYLNPVTRYRSEEVMITPKTFELESLHTQSVSIRASLWWQGMKAFQSVNPLWGGGTGDVDRIMQETGKHYHISNVLDSANPHNQFLYTLIGLGGIGLLGLLGCLYLSAYFALRQHDYFYLGFLSIFTLLCLTESALEFQKGIAFFALFNSILVFNYCDLQIPSLKRVPL